MGEGWRPQGEQVPGMRVAVLKYANLSIKPVVIQLTIPL